MAYEKQDWKNALHAAYEKRDRQDDRTDIGEKKKISRLQYKRRKVEKEIRNLIKTKNPIKYKDILEIHGRYGY